MSTKPPAVATDAQASAAIHRPATGAGNWLGVEALHYKQEGSAPFRDVSRRVLFGDAQFSSQLRYFEVQAGGYTTLERHRHAHAVLILRGGGKALVGDAILTLAEHDLVSVPPLTWHQFRAPHDGPLGFLCMVNVKRDRPQLPTAAELETLRSNPRLAAFLRD